MALLLISTNTPNAAIEYLEKAIENDERNIFAHIDLLRLYMSNIPTHKKKLEQIFSNLTKKQWKKYDEILILKAVYTFFKGSNEDCVDLLIRAVKVNAKCIDSLERLKSNFSRFNWGEFNSFSHNIKSILIVRMALSAGEEPMYTILYTIWKSLKDSDRRDEFRRDECDRSHGAHGSTRSGGSNYSSGYNDNAGSQATNLKCEQDCYAILGISKTATHSEIKKSYMKLAKEHHPDKNMYLPKDQLLQKQEIMKHINYAYDNDID